jgi:hypothetical protein
MPPLPAATARHARFPAFIAVLALGVGRPAPAPAQQEFTEDEPSLPSVTATVFRRFADRVVKIEVVETGSAGKASVASGFFVGPDGELITNYHVIADVVHEPERYRAEAVQHDGQRVPAALVAVDVVHDLALVRVATSPPSFFGLRETPVEQGARLYSMGHPADLGLSIVEGTYNGPLRHTLYERIHFTGSLNPGMSGGPAITASGRVVGINVATAGNQLSFLVPTQRAAELLAGAGAAEDAPGNLIETIGRQMRDYQDAYLEALFEDSVPTVVIDGYRLPTEPATFFNCWADVTTFDEDPYTIREHHCSTDDYLFISRDHFSGILEIDHELITSDEFGRVRFFSLYSTEFRASHRALDGSETDVTAFRCRASNVRRLNLKFRAAFCVRRYRRFEGLYDVVFKLAALGTGRPGLVSTLTMSGVSFENAQRVVRRYLESITWIE